MPIHHHRCAFQYAIFIDSISLPSSVFNDFIVHIYTYEQNYYYLLYLFNLFFYKASHIYSSIKCTWKFENKRNLLSNYPV